MFQFLVSPLTPGSATQFCEHPGTSYPGSVMKAWEPCPNYSCVIALELLNLLIQEWVVKHDACWAKNEAAVCTEVCKCTKGHTDWWPLKIGHLCQEERDDKVYYSVKETCKWWGHLNSTTFSPSILSFEIMHCETQESESLGQDG